MKAVNPLNNFRLAPTLIPLARMVHLSAAFTTDRAMLQMGAWYSERAAEVDRSCGQLSIAAGLLSQGGGAAGASDSSLKLSAELRQLQASLSSGM